MESFYNNMSLIQLLLKWKKHLIIITVLAAVLAAIFSGPTFITPKYKSDAVLYPSNIAPYSEESETEQMLQILQSGDIRDQIITLFDLGKHYGLNPEDPHYRTYLINEYSDNIKITKTQYESVQIVVMDSDPQIACNIIDSIILLYDKKIRELHELKFGEVVVMYSRALAEKKTYIDSLQRRQNEIMDKYGFISPSFELQEIARGYLGTSDGPASKVNTKAVNNLRKNLATAGSEAILLENLIVAEALNLADIQKEYDIAIMNFNRKYTYANIITSPYAADKKTYPVRWLIVLFAIAGTIFFELIIISIIEAAQKKQPIK